MNTALVDRIRSCATLPSLPTIAVQVLDLAQKAEVDIAEIARIISKDPALSGKILRTVNSSFYGRSQAVSTISHALVILGLQSVKTLVLGFSLVSNLAGGKGKGFEHMSYWKRSIYVATGAKIIAAKIEVVQQEEAFLIGLLSDIGMLVLHQVLGDEYRPVVATAASHVELPAAETTALKMTHADVSGLLVEQWKLPPLLTVPIKAHHTPETIPDPALRKLAEVVKLASRCADVFVDPDAAEAIADVRAAAKALANFSLEETDALLAEISRQTKEMATLFEINIGSSVSFDAILSRASETLIELSLQTQLQSSTLQQQNQRLQQEVLTDKLTGLANRAAYDLRLAAGFEAFRTAGTPLALLVIDLDKFKSINDGYGHPAGDEVLRHVGKILKAAARTQDLAARHGGEELALVLHGTARGVATIIADAIRRSIAGKPVKIGTVVIPVTASIGVASLEAGSPLSTLTHLVKAADLALYNAKNSGRNRVKVFEPKKAA